MRDHEEVLRQLLSDLREKERASAVLGDHDGLLKYGSEADAIDATLAEPTTLRKRLAEARDTFEAELYEKAQRSFDIQPIEKLRDVFGDVVSGILHEVWKRDPRVGELEQRLNEAQRERDEAENCLLELDGHETVARQRAKLAESASLRERLARFEAGQKPLEGESRSRLLRHLGVADIDEAISTVASLRERLAEAEREREMVCYWLHPLDGEGPIRAAKRYREGWQASEQRVERLEAALRRIIEEEQSIILNGLPIGYISQSLHFATAALAESAPKPAQEVKP